MIEHRCDGCGKQIEPGRASLRAEITYLEPGSAPGARVVTGTTWLDFHSEECIFLYKPKEQQAKEET